MAATVDSALNFATGSAFEAYTVQLSALVSDAVETVTVPLARPNSTTVGLVLPIVTTGATSGDQVTVEWVKASDSATNGTVAVRARVAAGGDITGAVITVYILYFNRGAGGLLPP